MCQLFIQMHDLFMHSMLPAILTTTHLFPSAISAVAVVVAVVVLLLSLLWL